MLAAIVINVCIIKLICFFILEISNTLVKRKKPRRTVKESLGFSCPCNVHCRNLGKLALGDFGINHVPFSDYLALSAIKEQK